eukprot:3746294-Amphidinium_carterae.1
MQVESLRSATRGKESDFREELNILQQFMRESEIRWTEAMSERETVNQKLQDVSATGTSFGEKLDTFQSELAALKD